MAKRSLVFDTGPIISLATNNLLWLLEPMRKKFSGEFYITPAVKEELVDRPLETKRFEFEALQVLKLIRDGILKVVDSEQIQLETDSLTDISNKCFKAKGNWITIMHRGELEALAAVNCLNASAFVADERTARLLIENPVKIGNRLRHKLHTNVVPNHENLNILKKSLKEVKVIRSIELVTVAFKMGLLDMYLTERSDSKWQLLDSVLWGVKSNGCAVSQQEIDEIMNAEVK